MAIGMQQKITAAASRAKTRSGGQPITVPRVDACANAPDGSVNSGGWRRKIAASGTTAAISTRA
jgi:hypothetical protein